VVLCSYVLKLSSVFDPTPFVLGIILSSVVILIWSRKVYDFSSLASGILLDNMNDGVIAIDKHKRIVSYNPAATAIFRDLSPQTIGKHIEELEGFPQDILDDDSREEFSLNDCFYQGHVQQIPDKYGEKKGYVILILDVTETRNYIEEIKQVREQAEQANIAKSAFLANMSHEIRTPMNAIVGLSDIIMEESKGRKVYGYACDIKSSSRNLLALINDILDLSKVEAGKMDLVLSEYHLKTLVDEVLNMMDIVASQHGLMLMSEFDMSIPCRYLGDEGRIKQILINLLNNALKFTKKGHVKISVAGMPGEAPDTERLIFSVEDTGCGIREEDLEKIFENFRQLDSKRNRRVEGTGLGLSITRHLAELMDGSVKVESVFGEGSTFIVDIMQKVVDSRPLSDVPEEEIQKEQPLELFTAKNCRVLVVDDNLINRKVARSLLQSYDLEITEAESGMEAIQFVKGSLYDIIFMDHMMPGMDGIEAVQHIRSECGENGTLPVIIALTANAMEGVREAFLANGFQDFLTKPIDRRTLHMILLRWIPEEKQTKGGGWIKNLQASNNNLLKLQDIIIEGIDTDDVADHSSANSKEFIELLNLYCLDGKRKLEVLRDLWEEKDYKAYGIEVHALK
ncbi:MAG: response regulator, partial [Lachnospiraceae bacterium]|nr:response regulator [Lachnospiraceae bacterium]